MKHYIRNITWKFKDSTETYPQLKDRKIKVSGPEDIFNNFRFYLKARSKNDSSLFGSAAQMLSPGLR